MSQKYALPCSQCSATVEVETRQAGQQVTCAQCGHVQDAPRLGALRQLESVGHEPQRQPVAKRGSGMFVAGILLILVGFGGGGGLYSYGNSMIVDYNVDGGMDRLDAESDAFTASQIVLMFENMNVDEGLGDWEEQPHVAQSREGEILRILAIPLGLLGLVGLALLGISLIRR